MNNYKKIRFSELNFNTHFPRHNLIEYAGYVNIPKDTLFYQECNAGGVKVKVSGDIYDKGIDFHTHPRRVTPSFWDLLLSFISLNDESWIITPHTVNVLRPVAFKDYNFELFGDLLKSLPKILEAEDPRIEFNSLILPLIREAEVALGVKIVEIGPDKESFTIKHHRAFTVLTSTAMGLESKLYKLRYLKKQVQRGKYQVIKRDTDDGMNYINYWGKSIVEMFK